MDTYRINARALHAALSSLSIALAQVAEAISFEGMGDPSGVTGESSPLPPVEPTAPTPTVEELTKLFGELSKKGYRQRLTELLGGKRIAALSESERRQIAADIKGLK